MKKIGILFPFLFALVLIFTPNNGSAQINNPSMEQIEQYLLEQGFPQDYISILADEQKQGFYRDEAIFVTLDTVDGLLSEKDTIQAFAMKNWTGTVSTVQVKSGIKGILKYRLTYNLNWNQRANFNLTDKFGIAWSNDWDALENSSISSYTPKGINSAGGTSSVTYNYTGYGDYKPGNGIGWAFDIKHNFTGTDGKYYETSSHSGYGSIDIVKAHNGSGRTDSSSSVGQYFHKQGTVNGSLGFNGSEKPSISISFSIGYDESPQAGKQWYWTHKDYW